MKIRLRSLLPYLCSILFSLFFAHTASTQSLYNEALRLSEALQNNQPSLVISSDSVQRLDITYGDAVLPELYKNLQVYPSDSLQLDKQGTFRLPYPGHPYQLQLVYDTLRMPILTIPDSTEVVIQNELTNCKVLLDTTQVLQFKKYNYLIIHSILGANLNADPEKPVRYDFSQVKNIYSNNPFLQPLLGEQLFQTVSPADSLRDVLSISAVASQFNNNSNAKALSLVYADSSLSANDFLKIKNVVQEYQKPEVSTTTALKAISSSIQTNRTLSSPQDYSTALIAGLADFIAERAQEEFNYSFMQSFEKRLAEIPELGVLFPKTKSFLDNIKLANYKTLLITARGAFINDLDNLGINLPGLLSLPKYKSLETNSEVFNLLTIYSMVDLAYRGMAIDTIVPLTYQKFKVRNKELQKTTNIELAKKLFNTQDLSELADSIDQFEQLLIQAKQQINLKQSQLLRDYNFELVKLRMVDPDFSSAAANQLRKIYRSSFDRINDLYNNQLRVGWDSVSIIPNYLRGTPAYDLILKDPRIEDFKKYFGAKPDSIRLIASGLELSRILVDGYNGGKNKVQVLRTLNRQLNWSKRRLDQFIKEQNTDQTAVIRQAIAREDRFRENLRKAIFKDIPFWQKAGADTHEIKGLEFIAGTLQDFYYADQQVGQGPDSLFQQLDARRTALSDIQNVLKADLLELYEDLRKRKKLEQYSPLLDSLTRPVATVRQNPSPLQELLTQGEVMSNDISQQIHTLRRKYSGEYLDAQLNSASFASAMELSSQLMYCLKGDPASDQKWISADEFNRIMSNQVSREVYLGLIYQRLSDLKLPQDLSSDGVASLVSNIVATIGDINITRDSIQIKKEKKIPLQFKDYFPFLKTSVRFVNNVITTPVLVKPEFDKATKQMVPTAVPLTAELSALKNVPQISETSVNLFENLSQKDYGRAIASFANLFEVVATNLGPDCSKLSLLDPQQRKICEDKNRTVQKILKYGTFISDVAVAKTPNDIQTAFANASAPSGSSQVKRTNLYDISLNGYFGLAFGRENLEARGETKLFPPNSISLSAPIGISFSTKFKESWNGSWTFFLSALDLGAVTAFRLNSDDSNLPELNLQNVIAPGAFLYYNIANSPFSVGGGWQYGPLVRKIEVNGETIETNASRILLSFTIDVPLFGIYTADGK